METSIPTPEQQAIINHRVKTGLNKSARAVLDQALAALEEREKREARKREWFNRELKPALDELDRGEGTPLDFDAIRKELQEEWDNEGIPQ